MKNSLGKTLKRAISLALAVIIAIPAVAFANVGDGLTLTDPVQNTYTGRAQASRLIGQLQFTDMPASAASRDAIVRSGALEMTRPTGTAFRPNALTTREEAIAYALRAAGLSGDAMALAAAIELPLGTPLGTAWSMGYLQLASTIGMITPAQFDEALASLAIAEAAIETPAGMPALVLPDTFGRTDPATREEIAAWIFAAFNFAQAGIFDTETPVAGLSLQSFTDWQSISAGNANAVEMLLRHNIIMGQTDTVFAPASFVPRVQMAQILRSLDSIHHTLHGLERLVGTVGAMQNTQVTGMGAGTLQQNIHIRRGDGGVDVLQFSATGGLSPQTVGAIDAVVLRGGNVTGLSALEIGDQIEYIVHPATSTVVFVNVSSPVEPHTMRVRLENINMTDGTITFRNAAGVSSTHAMSRGLYGVGHDGTPFIRARNRLNPVSHFPIGGIHDITLMGVVVTSLEFVGEAVLIPEHRGIVIENNPIFGYITILDANRHEQSFIYNVGELVVQRRQFFDMRDTIGGWHEMFPGVHPHPRTASMDDVIPGDIVVFRVSDDDPMRIIELSAAENTIERYGRIVQIRDQGGYFDMLMEFENGQTAWYTFTPGILVREHGRPVSANRIQVGDWARVIINQAVLGPGITMESIREISLDSGGHHITRVITGTVAGFNQAQNLLQIHHAQELTPAGWRNHQPLASYNISGPNVRYYFDGRPVNLAFINRYIARSAATVYMALENHFAGERAVKVSVRSGRDELIRSGTVLHAANNSFGLLEIPGDIAADAGTIVVRNDRLVDSAFIFAEDWARVALNGATAAVVDISAAPATSGVQIVRGRVAQVWPFESFRVETMSIFDGFRWNFTPIPREFTIDHNTLFINDGGVTSIDEFLGFTDDSVIGQTFNVIVEGGRAVRVIDAPFTEPIPQLEGAPGHLTTRGIIYEIEGETISIRDVTVFDGRTGAWNRISIVNPTGTVTVAANTIIVDRNEVIPASRLQVGQQILAFSPTRRDEVALEPGIEADAFIVLVEN